jgi:hypothetical protein
MRRPQIPPENPWLTYTAAETLRLNGHKGAAAECLKELGDPTEVDFAIDPLDFWIMMEDNAD